MQVVIKTEIPKIVNEDKEIGHKEKPKKLNKTKKDKKNKKDKKSK